MVVHRFHFKISIMRTRIFIFAICTLLVTNVFAQKKKAENETLEFRYEAEATTGQAVQGYVLLKVYTYSKDKNVALTLAGRNAVHAVLFKGCADNNDNARIKGTKPIISNVNAYEENKKFFEEFFKESGNYQKYIQLVNNGIPGPGDIIKVGKEYKVGVKVLVNKTALRKAMEEAGIIKALGGGF